MSIRSSLLKLLAVLSLQTSIVPHPTHYRQSVHRLSPVAFDEVPAAAVSHPAGGHPGCTRARRKHPAARGPHVCAAVPHVIAGHPDVARSWRADAHLDRKSTRLNSSHANISY